MKDKENNFTAADIIARKKQRNNKIFETHRKNVMPQFESIISGDSKRQDTLPDNELPVLIKEAYQLIDHELRRNNDNLATIRAQSEQLREDDVIDKFLDAEDAVLVAIDELEQKRSQLDNIVADACSQVKDIISDIGGFGHGQAREFYRPDEPPAAYGGPMGMVKVDKENDPDGMKSFEQALAGKAAGMGISPDIVAKAAENVK